MNRRITDKQRLDFMEKHGCKIRCIEWYYDPKSKIGIAFKPNKRTTTVRFWQVFDREEKGCIGSSSRVSLRDAIDGAIKTKK